jgi:hypothetical protein
MLVMAIPALLRRDASFECGRAKEAFLSLSALYFTKDGHMSASTRLAQHPYPNKRPPADAKDRDSPSGHCPRKAVLQAQHPRLGAPLNQQSVTLVYSDRTKKRRVREKIYQYGHWAGKAAPGSAIKKEGA